MLKDSKQEGSTCSLNWGYLFKVITITLTSSSLQANRKKFILEVIFQKPSLCFEKKIILPRYLYCLSCFFDGILKVIR